MNDVGHEGRHPSRDHCYNPSRQEMEKSRMEMEMNDDVEGSIVIGERRRRDGATVVRRRDDLATVCVVWRRRIRVGRRVVVVGVGVEIRGVGLGARCCGRVMVVVDGTW